MVDVTSSTSPISPTSSHQIPHSACLYYGQVFSEKAVTKTWNAKFMVSKRLNTLQTVRNLELYKTVIIMTISYYLQFIRKSIPHAKEASSLICFKFKDEYLTVNYGQQETFEEWKVTPSVKSPHLVNVSCTCMHTF